MLDNLGIIEQRVYRAYWNDGLLDLFAAVGVLATGIFWILDFPVGTAMVPAFLVPLWGPLRKRMVEPRLGMVEFGDARKQRTHSLLVQAVLLGCGFLALAVTLYFFRDHLPVDPSGSLIAGLPAMLVGLMALITTILVATPRFLIHAALLVVAGLLGALLGVEPGWILAAAGSAMLVVALFVVVRFVQNNRIDAGTPG